MNKHHLADREGDDALMARVRSYELAAKMQLAVPEVMKFQDETEGTKRLYGLDVAATDIESRSRYFASEMSVLGWNGTGGFSPPTDAQAASVPRASSPCFPGPTISRPSPRLTGVGPRTAGGADPSPRRAGPGGRPARAN